MCRINLNSDKKSADTHVLQEYVKKNDDTYSVRQEIAKGNYWKCDKFLKDIIKSLTNGFLQRFAAISLSSWSLFGLHQ